MPSSYSLYLMEAFPNASVGQAIEAPRRMNFELPGTDEDPKTELVYQRSIDTLDTDVFRGLHEYVVAASGRAKGVQFTQYIETSHFPVYFNRSIKLLMLKTNKDVATGTMKQLNKNKDILGRRRKIDLNSVRGFIEHYKGAWFKVSDSADVSSQALFGPSIERDLRFVRASEEGEMFNIRLDYLFHDELIPIGISNDSNIVTYNDNLDEHLELELILDVKKTLIDAAADSI